MRPITRSLLALTLALSALPAASARAEPLLRGLGGPADFGPGNLPANDDGSSAVIDVSAAFPAGLRFFGMTFTALHVNNNGNVSFGGSVGTFTPSPFPIASQRMIAAWWGDVDTRGGGVPARNGVYWSITPGRFVATWHDVGYYSHHDDLQNDFQIILTAAGPGPGDFDVELRYNRCEWTTGDASGGEGGFGGTPAQAGFDAGNLRDYVSLPGSLTMSVLELCDTSNVGVAGVWRFAIRDGEVTCPGFGTACETGAPGVCSAGTIRCRGEDAVCVADAEPSDEVCDGEDDDCDARVDEELGSTTCGVGICERSIANCIAGTPQECVPGPPGVETCNLIDDDCSGVVDDAPWVTCGIGACEVSVPGCRDGVVNECVPGEPGVELCNGEDDDCNGLVDDALDACMFVPDAGTCAGYLCDPDRLYGRAGPIGCACRAGRARGGSRAGLALALFALVTLRTAARRSRTRAPSSSRGT